MFNRLLHQLQRRYTYRQRFLFIVAFFFCAIPYPTYWLFNTQKTLLEHTQRQLITLNSLNAIDHFIYQAISYRNTIPGKGTVEENSATQALAEQLAQIQDHLAEPLPANFNLGEAFQWNTPNSYLAIALKNTIEEIFSLTFQEERSITPQFIDQINLCSEMLHQLALTTGFYVSEDKLRSACLNATLMIPQMQALLLQHIIYPQTHPDGLNLALNRLSHTLLPVYSQFKSSDKELQQKARDVYQAALRWQTDMQVLTLDYRTSASPISQAVLQNIVDDNETWRTLNHQFLKQLLTEYEYDLIKQHVWSAVLLITLISVILICTALRVLSKHLTGLLTHFEALAHGDFSTHPYPNVKDPFAQVGLTLNLIANTLSNISGRIRSLGFVLADSSDHLSYETRTQETNVLEQEVSIHSSTHIAARIATNCRYHADVINELNYKSLSQPLTQSIQQALFQMGNTMTLLADNSHSIIAELTTIQEHLKQAVDQSNLLNSISNEAHQLAINAAIEANHPAQDMLQTHAIQRFSTDTAQAVEHIHSIIDSVSLKLSNTKESVNKCCEVMTDGGKRLGGFKNELSAVADQTILQTTKFDELNQILQQQAYEAENIISALRSLQTNAQATTQIFKQLSRKVKKLGGATEELKGLLLHFFSHIKQS